MVEGEPVAVSVPLPVLPVLPVLPMKAAMPALRGQQVIDTEFPFPDPSHYSYTLPGRGGIPRYRYQG